MYWFNSLYDLPCSNLLDLGLPIALPIVPCQDDGPGVTFLFIPLGLQQHTTHWLPHAHLPRLPHVNRFTPIYIYTRTFCCHVGWTFGTFTTTLRSCLTPTARLAFIGLFRFRTPVPVPNYFVVVSTVRSLLTRCAAIPRHLGLPPATTTPLLPFQLRIVQLPSYLTRYSSHIYLYDGSWPHTVGFLVPLAFPPHISSFVVYVFCHLRRACPDTNCLIRQRLFWTAPHAPTPFPPQRGFVRCARFALHTCHVAFPHFGPSYAAFHSRFHAIWHSYADAAARSLRAYPAQVTGLPSWEPSMPAAPPSVFCHAPTHAAVQADCACVPPSFPTRLALLPRPHPLPAGSGRLPVLPSDVGLPYWHYYTTPTFCPDHSVLVALPLFYLAPTHTKAPGSSRCTLVLVTLVVDRGCGLPTVTTPLTPPGCSAAVLLVAGPPFTRFTTGLLG